MRSLLWILPKWPLPANDGSRVATVALISALAARGHQIDLLALAEEGEVVDSVAAQAILKVRRVLCIRRPPRPHGRIRRWVKFFKAAFTMPHIPVTMQPYASPHIKCAMATLLTERRVPPSVEDFSNLDSAPGPWDAVIYEGPHPAMHSALLGEFRRPRGAPKIIYRAQNVEHLIWKRKTDLTSGTAHKILLAHQLSLVKIFEESLVKEADGVAAVSKADLALFERMKNGLRGAVVPVGYNFDEPLALTPQATDLLCLARLDWLPNQEGIKWLLEKVWPVVVHKRQDLTLTIAGSGDASWLTPYLSLKNLNFLGCVPETRPLYRRCLAALVPVFYGSGTRVKAIEAVRFGRMLISTQLGVEGLDLIPGHHYLQAETAQDWIDGLSRLTFEQAVNMGSSAFAQLRYDFSAHSAAQRFEVLLKDVLEGVK